jgi:ABC-type Fe3+-siderophore transport system permease subunit
MKLSTYLSIAAIIGLVYGLMFLLASGFMLVQYGVPAEPHNLLQVRYFGSALVWGSLIVWLARHVRDDAAIRAILIGSAVGFVLGAVISLWGVMSGLTNALGWSSVVVYLVLLAGAVYFLAPARRPLPA